MYDFKPTILFIGSLLMIPSVNEILTTSILMVNLTYVSYQFYQHHKKNK